MDLWSIITMIFLIFLVMSCCGYCCRRKTRGAVLSTPVVVTSTTHTVQGGYPTQPGVPYQTNVYMQPAQPPYPTQGGASQMPMPMNGAYPPPAGVQAYVAPYPTQMPMPMQSGNSGNPPSYDTVVAGNSSGQPNTALYEKQQPYNPSFTAQ